MGKLALSQNTSLDGVMQSPGPTDVPFKYRGWAVDFDGSREGARFNYEEEVGLEEAQTPRPSCSDGSPTPPCRLSRPQRKVGSPTG